MALSQKHRSLLYDDFAGRVGEEAAEALMAEFPAHDGDELVTKDFLRAELATLRADILVRQTAVLLGAMSVATGIILAAVN
jgi:hypothetical protein